MALADVANMLKHDYKNLTDLMNNSVGLIAQLEKNTDSIHGDYAVIAMEVGREFGFGARLENEVLPAGESVAPQQTHVKVKRVYGKYRMTGPEIAAMETDVGSFSRAQSRRIKNLKNMATRDSARQAWGDGAGKLATCGTTTAANVVVLAASTPEQALVNLEEGARIDIGTAANPQLVASNRLITAVDFTNATVTIDGPAITTTSADFLFRQGSGGNPQTVTQREMTGVSRLIDDDTTLQDLDPAVVTKWKSLVIGNSGTLRPPSEALVETATRRLENRSGAKVDAFYCGGGVFQAMVNLLKAKQRVVNTLQLQGGHTGVDFTFGAMNAALVHDRDADLAGANSLWGIEHASIQSYIQWDWGWEDLDGDVLRLATDGTHSFEAIYRSFRELGIEQRNHNLRIDDIEGATA